jgi:hypothetical protein
LSAGRKFDVRARDEDGTRWVDGVGEADAARGIGFAGKESGGDDDLSGQPLRISKHNLAQSLVRGLETGRNEELVLVNISESGARGSSRSRRSEREGAGHIDVLFRLGRVDINQTTARSCLIRAGNEDFDG